MNQLLEPIGRCLTPEVAKKLAAYRFDAKTQLRVDKLARKCNEGQLTAKERREYEACVQTIDFISLLQAKARGIVKRATAE